MTYRPITDTWILARPKVKYYGAYPSGFLSRAREMLGIDYQQSLLHVCSGEIKQYPFRGFGPNDKTVDLDPERKPDFVMDVRKDLPDYHEGTGWPAILADPPYSEEDATHYKVGKEAYPNPNKLLKLMLQKVKIGGRVGMIHYVCPRPPSRSKLKRTINGQEVECKVRFVGAFGVLVGFANKMRCYGVFELEAPEMPKRKPEFKKVKPSVFFVS